MFLFVIFTINIRFVHSKSFFLKPFNATDELLLLQPNLALRIKRKSINKDDLDRTAIKIKKIDNKFVKLKLGDLYLCESNEKKNIVTNQNYNENHCARKINKTEKEAITLKIGGKYLIKTSERDNRRITEGYKIRLVPNDKYEGVK